MSIKTWKKEFYPVDAKTFKGEDQNNKEKVIACVEHSIQKWEGLSQVNLNKHYITVDRGNLIDSEGSHFEISGESCSLCQMFTVMVDDEHQCASCPLYQIRGSMACDTRKVNEYTSPWREYKVNNKESVMISWLKRTLRMVQGRTYAYNEKKDDKGGKKGNIGTSGIGTM